MDDLAKQLSDTRALANRFLMQQVEQTGLRGIAPSHGDILVVLFQHETVCMSDLSRYIARDPSTVTALVRKLVAMGLASTRKSPDDRRSTLVSLTERGQALRSDFDAISSRLQAAWHDGIDQDELECASRVLQKVQANLVAAIEKYEGKAE